MPSNRVIAWALLIPFAVLTAYALYAVGYIGIFDYHRHSPAGWQVFADLVVALILVLNGLVPDAKRRGRSPGLWIVLTLLLGSIGPLLYIVTMKRSEPEPT
ncbi:MAG: hypothetical protein AAGH76_17760 [Pseudomonadota bacterium]